LFLFIVSMIVKKQISIFIEPCVQVDIFVLQRVLYTCHSNFMKKQELLLVLLFILVGSLMEYYL